MFGLGPVASIVVLGTAVAVLGTASLSLKAALWMLGPALIVAVVTIVRWDGVPLSHAVQERIRWRWTRLRGHTSWRGGVMVAHDHAFDLPGALAPLSLLSAEDGLGGQYGVVWDQRSGMLTATVRCASSSTWLADRGDADAWVRTGVPGSPASGTRQRSAGSPSPSTQPPTRDPPSPTTSRPGWIRTHRRTPGG